MPSPRRKFTPNKQAVLNAVKQHPGECTAWIAAQTSLDPSFVTGILDELRSHWQYVVKVQRSNAWVWYPMSTICSGTHKNWKLVGECCPTKIAVRVTTVDKSKPVGTFTYLYADTSNAEIAIEKTKWLLDSITNSVKLSG